MRKKATEAKDARRGRVLPNDACPECGTLMKQHRSSWSHDVNGETFTVPSVRCLKCPRCGEEMIDIHELGRMMDLAKSRYREKYNLLTPDEIRSLRKRFDLTQAELARLLRLGGNTISRWESGRNVQTGANDILLRLIRDLPGSLAWLRKHAA